MFDNCTFENATVTNVTVVAGGGTLTLRICVDDTLPALFVPSPAPMPIPVDEIVTTEEPETVEEIVAKIREESNEDGDLTKGVLKGVLIGGGVLIVLLIAAAGRRHRKNRKERVASRVHGQSLL